MIKFKIKNWPIAFIALIFFCFLMSLSFWQLKRATEKKQLLRTFAARTKQSSITLTSLKLDQQDLRFYRATFTGHFDQDHIFLLDNKIFHGKVGYEVYVPFKISTVTDDPFTGFPSRTAPIPQMGPAAALKNPVVGTKVLAGLNTAILVDRGFVPIINRQTFPVISKVPVESVSGMLNLPPKYFAFGHMVDTNEKSWPRRVEFIRLSEIEKIIGYPLSPYVLNLAPNHPAAYPIEWQITVMGPERHLGYAFQWFALALTLLILFVALNIERKRKGDA